ncbi:hypothetical protein D9M68_869350 [compost metagenome]
MARVHGLQHVDRLGTAHLTNDDAVGPHAQRVAHQRTLRDLALALDVHRPRFHPCNVRLLELELGRIFDGDDAFGCGNEP